jgi:4-hydroxybenzoate polyprenyltransferase
MSHHLAVVIAVVFAGLLLWLLGAMIIMVVQDWRDVAHDRRRDREIDRRDREAMRGELSTWDRF